MIADPGHSAQIVEAIQAGADDFVRRPYTAEDLETAIRPWSARPRREAAPRPAEENGERLQRELALLVSPQMREIQQVIEQAARADVDRADLRRDRHRQGAGGPGHPRPLPAPTGRLRQGQLRGHAARAARERAVRPRARRLHRRRTSASRAGSSSPTAARIFLDEIGELHAALQAKLLHVLQDGEFSRVGGTPRHPRRRRGSICATNRDLEREVRGRPLPRGPLLPPQRHQHPGAAAARAARGDSRRWSIYFVAGYARVFNVAERGSTPTPCRRFLAYHWPGNIRELENFIKRMIVLQDWTLPRTLIAPAVPPPRPRRRSRSPPPRDSR